MKNINKTIIIIGLILIFIRMVFSQSDASAVVGNKTLKTINDTRKYLNIPQRSANALEGSEFVSRVTGLRITDREKALVKEILSGNVPSFSRKLRPLKIIQSINGKDYELIFYTVCDYMAIGSDTDYLYIPMTPSTAQYLADKLNCSLPTKKMVDIIYTKAEVKLRPQPIPPSDKMTTVPVFWQHTDSIKRQISQIGLDRSTDNIIGGHKKDIIISNKIYSADRDYDRVVIYGWHRSVNDPIQPVYNGHITKYADYSHGVRMISNIVFLNNDSMQIDQILEDPNLSILLSSEGVISKPYYPESDIFTAMGSRFEKPRMDFTLDQNYPNPFGASHSVRGNSSTIINYQLSRTSIVDLSLFNMAGRASIWNIERNSILKSTDSANINHSSPATMIFF